MFPPFDVILRLFAAFPWPIWDAEGPSQDPLRRHGEGGS